MIINYGHVGGGGGLLLFGVGVVQFLKTIIHLHIFCVVLEGWVFIKLGKGMKGGVFVV